jgi:outer membrane lipoprotein
MRRIMMAMFLFLVPTAVSAGSPVPTDLYAEVDHGLRPASVLADPEAYRGRILLLGGVVERTVSAVSAVTLTVSCWQLDRDDRPVTPDATQGAIVAGGAGLDGAGLQPGRLVTLVGQVVGRGDAPDGKLPRLEIRFIHPWPTAAEEAAARQAPCGSGGCCDRWADPWWHDPWCDPWYCGPYPRWGFGAGYRRNWH